MSYSDIDDKTGMSMDMKMSQSMTVTLTMTVTMSVNMSVNMAIDMSEDCGHLCDYCLGISSTPLVESSTTNTEPSDLINVKNSGFSQVISLQESLFRPPIIA